MLGVERTIADLCALYRSGAEVLGDPLRISRLTYLDLEEPYRSINHSCDPNLGLRGTGSIFTLRPVKQGEELTYDYSTTMWEEGWPDEFAAPFVMTCQCAAISCRRLIADFPTLPPERQAYYLRHDAVLDFIRERLFLQDRTNFGTLLFMKPVLEARFFQTDAGAEPVRDWLKGLPAAERRTIGEDQNGAVWLASRHAAGRSSDGWHLGSTYQAGPPHRPRPVRAGWTNDGAPAWLHQEAAGHPETRSRSGPGPVKTVETEMSMGRKNIGSSFDDFLEEQAMLGDATAVAIKRVIAWQIAEEMKHQKITKTELAKRMHTSRAALNRLLDEEDTSLTLTTLASAAAALGKTINFRLTAA